MNGHRRVVNGIRKLPLPRALRSHEHATDAGAGLAAVAEDSVLRMDQHQSGGSAVPWLKNVGERAEAPGPTLQSQPRGAALWDFSGTGRIAQFEGLTRPFNGHGRATETGRTFATDRP